MTDGRMSARQKRHPGRTRAAASGALYAGTGRHPLQPTAEGNAAKIEPLITMGREAHHPSLNERFAAAPPPPKDPTPVEAMAYRLATPEGKKLYRLRKQMPEPVFRIIKSVMGFRQFLLRGID
jgi:hypothetical protein